jgi:hypothetical protein
MRVEVSTRDTQHIRRWPPEPRRSSLTRLPQSRLLPPHGLGPFVLWHSPHSMGSGQGCPCGASQSWAASGPQVPAA